ncbi:IS256 family transposase, partial [Mycobacterium tuberculosis]|uniref:transposase n=1 Tax=Mycobacterium tuberculosis TaxID=1773 RepID=UPI000E39BA14
MCGAGSRARRAARSPPRPGSRPRAFAPRAAPLAVALPPLRPGRSFPAWLLPRRPRAARALPRVVAPCSLLGVSPRRLARLVAPLGVPPLSPSPVSLLAPALAA